MAAPRNVRTKSPRQVALRAPRATRLDVAPRATPRPPSSRPGLPPPSSRPAPPSSRPRLHLDESPTPPPMAIAVGPKPAGPRRAEATAARPAEEDRVRGGSWALLVIAGLACLATAVAWRTIRHHPAIVSQLSPKATAAVTATAPAGPAPSTSAPSSAPASDWVVQHDGHEPLPGGMLQLPESFVPKKDGSYDLIVFFHGNPKIVLASVAHAKLDAGVAMINLGLRSGPYREAYRVPGAFEELLDRIDRGMARRGVREPKLNRLALMSWSAGYGAIESILQYRESPAVDEDPLDAIIALDGIHASFVDGDARRIRPQSLEIFVQAARAASEEQLMMLLTHSEIPTPGFASARRSQELILEELGLSLTTAAMSQLPRHVLLPEARGAAKKEQRMVPISDTRRGDLRVRGFEGDTADHHAAHLTQMSPVALVDLKRRWSPETR